MDSATAAFFALTGSMPPDTAAQAPLDALVSASTRMTTTTSSPTAALSSDAVVLTFEDLEAAQHLMYDHNAYHGLTFYICCTIYHWDAIAYGRPHSGTDFLFNGFGNDAEQITFATPVRSVGLWVGEPHDQPKVFWLEGYAGSTKIGESEQITLLRDQRYLAVEFGQPIDRLVFRRTNGWWVADDFCLSPTPGACALEAQAQAITFAPLPDKTFGDSDFEISATASSGLAVGFTTAGKCTVSGTSVHLTGAGTCTVTAHQPGNTSYLPAEEVTQSFTIAKATATLTLSGLSHTYDATAKSAAVTSAPASLSGVVLTYDGSPAAPANAGSYAVVATLANDDYQAEPATGTLTIAPATPTISWATPAPITVGTPLGPGQLNAVATGVGGVGVPGSFTYTPPTGATPAASPAQTLSVTFSSTNPNYGSASGSVQIAVLYAFAGFFQPVDNPTVVNKVKAGRAIPVKFSLAGDHGLAVLQTGSPTTTSFSCGSVTSEDLVEETLTASSSGLTYDVGANQYNYVWKTSAGWANGCRKLTLTLKDGTRHEALFHFVK